MVWHAGLLYKRAYFVIYGQVYNLTSSFLIWRQLRVVLDGKSSQECPIKVFVPPRPIIGPTFSGNKSMILLILSVIYLSLRNVIELLIFW